LATCEPFDDDTVRLSDAHFDEKARLELALLPPTAAEKVSEVVDFPRLPEKVVTVGAERMAEVCAELAVVDPPEFVAVTVTETFVPTSELPST
jgi:hypothetical protein